MSFAAETRFQPILVGAAVVLIGMSFGFNPGHAINPARDLGPRPGGSICDLTITPHHK